MTPPLRPGLVTAVRTVPWGWYRDALGRGARWHRVDCRKVTTAAAFHARLATALGLPGWYGANLDALYDTLCDLPPVAAGHVLQLDHLDAFARAAPGDWQAIVDVLADAANASGLSVVVTGHPGAQGRA